MLFQRTTDPLIKFVPVTVRVKFAPPAVVDEGLRLVTVGAGLLTVKLTAVETTPPGFSTVTAYVPAVAISPKVIAAVNCVPLTKVVVRFVPFHLTTAPETKLFPLTVSVKANPPAVAEAGDRVVMAGVGLMTVKV